jgi:uncharacterized protein (TIGR03032 family)
MAGQSPTDVADGWREHRDAGGVLIVVASREIVACGFSMPHSPRLHEGLLYLLDSGTGQFGKIDLAAGRFEPMTPFAPAICAASLSLIGLRWSEFLGLGRTRARYRASSSMWLWRKRA